MTNLLKFTHQQPIILPTTKRTKRMQPAPGLWRNLPTFTNLQVKQPTSPENRAAMVSCSLPVKTAEGMISPNIKTRETDSTTANQDLRFCGNMKGEQKSIESEIDAAGSPMSTKRPGSLLDQNPSLFGNQCHCMCSFERRNMTFQQAEVMSFQ